jgi:small subunit ribosomal protein S1
VTGKVTEVDAKGAVIKLSDEVDGYLKAVDISFDRVDDARSELNVGDSVEAKVINVDRKSRALGLSIKAKDIDDEKEAVASLKEQDETSSPGTIGDLIKAQMDDQ